MQVGTEQRVSTFSEALYVPVLFPHAAVSSTLQILTLTALAFFVPLSRAQIAGTGTIQGTVTGPTGSFIPNATVTLTQQATQVKRVIQTDQSGVYIFPNIEIGAYTINVTAAGFASFVQRNNVLEVGSNIAVNVQMKVGGKTEIR